MGVDLNLLERIEDFIGRDPSGDDISSRAFFDLGDIRMPDESL